MRNKSKKTPSPFAVCLRLKAVRLALGLKQWQMADLLGLQQDHYKHFEGRTKPSAELVAKVTEKTQVPALALLNENAVTEDEFAKIVEALKSQRDEILRSIGEVSSYPGHKGALGGLGDGLREGRLGNKTVDYILGALGKIEDEQKALKQAIADLQEGKKPANKGFPKGRNRG